jgi:hypothetical protein
MRLIVPTIFAAAIGCAVSAIATQAAPAPGACSLFTKEEARSFSDGSKFFDLIPPEEDRFGNGSACSYSDFIIQVDPFPFATIDAERKKPGERFEAVPGVGDVAYAHENTRIGAAELYFRVGQRVATVQMDIPIGQTYATTKPRLIALSRALAAKLR